MSINYLEKITEVYCFVSVDENGEGIIGETMKIQGKEVFMPFVCADKDRMESLKPFAARIHIETGKKIKLIRLSNREELEIMGE